MFQKGLYHRKANFIGHLGKGKALCKVAPSDHVYACTHKILCKYPSRLALLLPHPGDNIYIYGLNECVVLLFSDSSPMLLLTPHKKIKLTVYKTKNVFASIYPQASPAD